MANYQGPERRTHPRLDGNFIVSYRIKEKQDLQDLSQTANVSKGGVKLTTNRIFENGTALIVSIKLPFVAKRIEVDGKVVGCKEIRKGLLYETRIQFVNIDSDFFRKLGIFVETQLSPNLKKE